MAEPAQLVPGSPDQMAAVLKSLILDLCVMFPAYIAGRLDKYKQNRYLFTLVLILLG